MMLLPAMLTTKRVALAVGRFIAEWWVEIVVVVLACGIFFQQTRVWSRDEKIVQLDRTIEDMKAAAVLAESKSAERGATTGAEATVAYVERNEKDRPVVERVVERVRNVCVRSPDPVRVPVSQGPRPPDEAAGRAEDREDDAFREAIADDLQACNSELNKLTALQDWVRANSGE